MSYAVMKDGSSWRAVDGPVSDPDDQSKSFPDPMTEDYSETLPPDPVAPPPSAAEVLAAAYAQRDNLLTVAALRIAPLQDAVDLSSETPDEAASLKAWKKYRVDVNRVTDQAGFPEKITWPISP
ncbi:tail fiber assembly protein [Pseudomonas asplenii]|uniref:tail fiber assembly protein n=1 Tax=Pseudomonas asplenii TaxID=53407 RepID=UPI0029FEF0E1|nr:tail fiber assembly protein [Pseudomonas asplenii]